MIFIDFLCDYSQEPFTKINVFDAFIDGAKEGFKCLRKDYSVFGRNVDCDFSLRTSGVLMSLLTE